MIDNKDLMRLVRYISSDVGLRNIDNYAVVRFGEIIMKYYPRLSFEDVREAFEMCVMGGLDQWLPRDKDGNADRNHYQSFSLEYIGKVLGAYVKRKGEERAKMIASAPKPVMLMPPHKVAEYKQKWQEIFREIYERWRDTGVMELENHTTMVYKELEKRGAVSGYEITDADREKARRKLLDKDRKGELPDGLGDYLRQMTESYDVNEMARKYAMIRAIEIGFSKMKEYEK